MGAIESMFKAKEFFIIIAIAAIVIIVAVMVSSQDPDKVVTVATAGISALAGMAGVAMGSARRASDYQPTNGVTTPVPPIPIPGGGK